MTTHPPDLPIEGGRRAYVTASGQVLYPGGLPVDEPTAVDGGRPAATSGPPFGPATPPSGLVYTSGPPATETRVDSARPARGELGIKERRSWKTWQLLSAVIVAAVVGMWINGATGSASGSTSGGSSGQEKLPPAAGAASSTTTTAPGGSATTTTTAAAAGGSATTTTTTAAAAGGSATTTTTAGGSTTVAGPNMVLVPTETSQGNWTSPAFTIAAGTWNIGWAYQCTPAPAAGPAFQVFVVNAGASAGSTPAVSESAASGQAITPETSTGSQQIIVQAPAGCRWAAKVTGFSG